MKSLCSISVPSIWSDTVDSQVDIKLLEEHTEKEQEIRNCIAQDFTLFNTHSNVMNGVMYVTYIFTK